MASLAAKYDYLEKLTRKICVSHNQEPKKRPYVPFQISDGAPSKKKKKNKQKPTKTEDISANKKKTQPKKSSAPSVQTKKAQKGTAAALNGTANDFSAVDILRQRLHQKIEESRGQGPPKDPFSDEVKQKREKRKQERERKKRKRKEFRMKKLADAKAAQIKEENEETETTPAPPSKPETKKEPSTIVFNKVEVGEEYVDKGTKLNEKKKRRKVKGTLTPLTGKNYKQLLTRVEARKAHLEQLREKDEEKAKKEEEKMRWTNVLYKAEGMKIKDNEDLLRASLKNKEKRKMQKKKKWEQRSQQVVERMQKKQDKRKRNIQKRKDAKVEKRNQRAKKKGRILPKDLKNASV